MGNRLFVANLSYNTSEQELRNEFAKCGTLTDVKIITDRETGRSRGFGFVQFASDAEAGAAIQAFNGFELGGRSLTVTEAEARQPRAGGGGRPNGNGGGYRSAPPPQDFEPDRNGGGRKSRGKDRKRDHDDWG